MVRSKPYDYDLYHLYYQLKHKLMVWNVVLVTINSDETCVFLFLFHLDLMVFEETMEEGKHFAIHSRIYEVIDSGQWKLSFGHALFR